MRSIPSVRLLPGAWCVLLSTVAVGPSLADDVHLENGGVFEDVVAEVTETHVIVEMGIGRIRLPKEQVARVVERTSPLQEFSARRDALLRDPSSSAESWVELARFARRAGLERAWQETALFAARLDSEASGLAELMAAMRYARDPDLGWIPYDEAMQRRGLVRYRGSWLEPERAAALHRAEAEQASTRAAERQRARNEQRSAAAERDEPVTGNDVALASIELAKEALRANRGQVVGVTSGLAAVGDAGVFIPSLPLSGSFGRRFGHGGDRRPADLGDAWDAMAVRQPGSIIPLRTFRRQLDPQR